MNKSAIKHLLEYLEEELKIKPLGVVTTDVYEQYSGEEIYIDGKKSGIVIAYIDYVIWLQKKYDIALNINNKQLEYIDLGLPSGTLWAAENADDGYYTFDEAVEKFGNNLPTKEQFKELIDNCDYKWDEERKGGVFTSKINGKSLFFSAAGYYHFPEGNIRNYDSHGYYWSSCSYSYENSIQTYSYYLFLCNNNVNLDYDCCVYRFPVRCVQN